MFGIPNVQLSFMNDPQKLALFTSGLALLAAQDPQRVLQALPGTLMAAAQLKQQQKDRERMRAIQQEELALRKQSMELQKQNMDLQRRKLEDDLKRREMFSRIFMPQPIDGNGQQQPSGQQASAVPGSLVPAGQAQFSLIQQLPASARALAAADPAFGRSLISTIVANQIRPRTPKTETLMIQVGGKWRPVSVNVSTPDGVRRYNELLKAGAIKATPQLALEQANKNPFEEAASESLKQDLQYYENLRRQNAKIESVLPRIINANIYQGKFEDTVANVVRVMQDVFGVLKDLDPAAIKTKRELSNKLVLDMVGGSLSKGITDEDRKFMIELAGVSELGPDMLLRVAAMRKAAERSYGKYLEFMEEMTQRRGVPIRKAESEWRRILEARDKGELDKIPEEFRRFVPKKITPDLIDHMVNEWKRRNGYNPRQPLVGFAKKEEAKAERELGLGQPKTAPKIMTKDQALEMAKRISAKTGEPVEQVLKKYFRQRKK